MSFKELYIYLKSIEPQNLVFNSPVGNVYNYYYNINESVEILDDLLKFQFYNNEEKILQLLTDWIPLFLFDFFFFINFCLNFGQVGNFNGYCSFPLIKCIDHRILLWNEPILEASATETLKMLFGGDTVPAKVKHSNDAVIMRTLVMFFFFFLSNNVVFPNNTAFRSRMFTYKRRFYKKLKI